MVMLSCFFTVHVIKRLNVTDLFFFFYVLKIPFDHLPEID